MNVDKCKTCNYCSDKIRIVSRYTCLLCICNCEDVPLDRCRYSKKESVINSKTLSDKRSRKV